MRSLILVSIVAAITVMAVHSQSAAGWINSYGDSIDECGEDVLQTSDGGYIAAGWTYSRSFHRREIYIVKTDFRGNMLWSKRYGGHENENTEAHCISRTSDGCYVVCGKYTVTPRVFSKIWLLKINDNGDTLWTQMYGYAGLNDGHSALETNDGGLIILGYTTYNLPTNNSNIYLIKTDSIGDTLWTRQYRYFQINEGTSILQTAEGDFVLTGTVGPDDYYMKALLQKTNSMGDTLWTNSFHLDNDGNFGLCVRETLDGGYAIAGYSEWMLGWNSTMYLIRTDSAGDSLWTRRVGDVYSKAFSLQPSDDGGFVLCGVLVYHGVYIVKTDGFGNMLWSNIYFNAVENIGYSIKKTRDNGYIITGRAYIDSLQNTDLVLIKIDSAGNEVGNQSSPQPPLEFTLHPPYPNPFNPSTAISFKLQAASRIKLAVYDITGKEVARLAEGIYPAGAHRRAFDATGLSSGIYFARLQAGDFTQTKKIVLVK